MSLARIVIVGGGFAGYHAERSLQELLQGSVEMVSIYPTDCRVTPTIWGRFVEDEPGADLTRIFPFVNAQ